MNIGVMKIGANITQSKNVKSAGNYDIFSLMDMIKEDHNITFITKKTRNTIINKPYKYIDIMKYNTINTLDILLIFNGAINFFGGKDSPELVEHWKIINEFKGKVFYIMTDLRYPLYQIMDFFKNKPWADKYFKIEEKLLIKRNDIRVVCQGRNLNKLRSILNKITSKRIVNIQPNNLWHFPIDWAINMEQQRIYTTPFKDRKVDLIYGGANRDSHRKKRLNEYYCNRYLNIEMFGPIDIDCGIKNKGTVSHNQFIKRMSNAKATVIVGDKTYEDNMFTLRMYESIYAGCILFIDRSFDSEHKFFESDNFLSSFNYVSTQKELNEKLLSVCEDQYKLIANKQLKLIKDMYELNNYRNSFIKILKR